jgi:nitrite reductase/ring-hydroxylating ferredoxin subunit
MLETFTRVAPAVPESFPATLQIEGVDVVLFRIEDRYFAISRWCPHRGADLKDGTCLGTNVKCPNHGFIFDLASGQGVSHPGHDLRAYEVRVEPDGLYLRERPARPSASAWG